MQELIPVTLVVGFLGSGKTTFINRILNGDHGRKIAVIENEFGEIGIDEEILSAPEDLIIEMSNGCICCSMRGDLVQSLTKLLSKSKDFDHIVIEATGMANPGPIIETFFSSAIISESFLLDSVIGLVDCANYNKNIEKFENNEQVAFFDQIAFSETLLLNKVDLIDESVLSSIKNNIRNRNPHVKLIETTEAEVDLDRVIGVGSFDLSVIESSMPESSGVEYPFSWGGTIELKAGFYKLILGHTHSNERLVFFKVDEKELSSKSISFASSIFFSPQRRAKRNGTLKVEENYLLDFEGKGDGNYIFDVEYDGAYALFLSDHPSHLQLEILDRNDEVITVGEGSLFKKAEHFHGDEINSISIEFEGALNPQSFEMFLNVLYGQYKDDIYRSKGVLHFYENDKKVLFQGVYSSLKFDHGRDWDTEKKLNKIVFIGKGLIGSNLEAGLKNCIVEETK